MKKKELIGNEEQGGIILENRPHSDTHILHMVLMGVFIEEQMQKNQRFDNIEHI